MIDCSRRRIACALLVTLTGLMPTPSQAADDVIGVGNFSHIVSDLDRALAFYRDGLGLEVTTNQPFSPNPAITIVRDPNNLYLELMQTGR